MWTILVGLQTFDLIWSTVIIYIWWETFQLSPKIGTRKDPQVEMISERKIKNFQIGGQNYMVWSQTTKWSLISGQEMMLDGIKAPDKLKRSLENHLQVYVLNIKSDF